MNSTPRSSEPPVPPEKKLVRRSEDIRQPNQLPSRSDSKDLPLRSRIQSLDTNTVDPNYELVRMNTKLNAKSSSIEGEDSSAKKSKSAKKVTFDHLLPLASDYFEEKESESISFSLSPLTIDTGEELSLDVFGLSSFDDTFLKPEIHKVSPILNTLPMGENNTIIKRKKNFKSLEERFIREEDLEMEEEESIPIDSYYLDPQPQVQPLDYRLPAKVEEHITTKVNEKERPESVDFNVKPAPRTFSRISLNQLNQSSKPSIDTNKSSTQDNSENSSLLINNEILAEQAIEQASNIEPKIQVSNHKISYELVDASVEAISEVSIPIEKYDELFGRFLQLESSYALLQEDNKQKTEKYQNLLSENKHLNDQSDKITSESQIQIKNLFRQVAILTKDKSKPMMEISRNIFR